MRLIEDAFDFINYTCRARLGLIFHFSNICFYLSDQSLRVRVTQTSLAHRHEIRRLHKTLQDLSKSMSWNLTQKFVFCPPNVTDTDYLRIVSDINRQ